MAYLIEHNFNASFTLVSLFLNWYFIPQYILNDLLSQSYQLLIVIFNLRIFLEISSRMIPEFSLTITIFIKTFGK